MSTVVFLAWIGLMCVLALWTGQGAFRLGKSLTSGVSEADGAGVNPFLLGTGRRTSAQVLLTPQEDDDVEHLRHAVLKRFESFLVFGFGFVGPVVLLARWFDGAKLDLGFAVAATVISAAAAIWAARAVRPARLQRTAASALVARASVAAVVAFVAIMLALWA